MTIALAVILGILAVAFAWVMWLMVTPAQGQRRPPPGGDGDLHDAGPMVSAVLALSTLGNACAQDGGSNDNSASD